MVQHITMGMGAGAESAGLRRVVGRHGHCKSTAASLAFHGSEQEVHNKGAERAQQCARQEIPQLLGSRADDRVMQEQGSG